MYLDRLKYFSGGHLKAGRVAIDNIGSTGQIKFDGICRRQVSVTGVINLIRINLTQFFCIGNGHKVSVAVFHPVQTPFKHTAAIIRINLPRSRTGPIKISGAIFAGNFPARIAFILIFGETTFDFGAVVVRSPFVPFHKLG